MLWNCGTAWMSFRSVTSSQGFWPCRSWNLTKDFRKTGEMCQKSIPARGFQNKCAWCVGTKSTKPRSRLSFEGLENKVLMIKNVHNCMNLSVHWVEHLRNRAFSEFKYFQKILLWRNGIHNSFQEQQRHWGQKASHPGQDHGDLPEL